jgi:pimeloyl-ACP methyl ester carboxylesterase
VLRVSRLELAPLVRSLRWALQECARVKVILIPGFWLDGASWDEVGVEGAVALTLQGTTLGECVDEVVAAIDGPCVLVGHSGGGAMAWAAADARPEQVRRVILVDAVPLEDGSAINAELPVVDGEVPLPDWSVFDEPDLIDLTDELRAAFRARAIPLPARVASDPQQLSDERRYDIPVTVVCCEFSGAELRGWLAGGFAPELTRIRDVTYVDLPTGHWPQFTRPAELGRVITDALP